ncbi:FecR family protein [Mucilaginibacter sp. UR6-11]|uniref:FecR family protein n=1 Tax=Mucilaginibacter sp. UR6-11 TaxID=1435644 RepID=UPI001E2F7F23|nr:FecR domain-containing protein [Mucilaginibacter sp. UR6-11]MCC8426389.1 FecR family protein [Mucilaginibacter sp. UR6-11]
MQEKDLEQLLKCYHAGSATSEEKALIETWYLKKEPYAGKIADEQILSDKEESLANLLKGIRPARVVKLWPRIAAAASILLLISVSVYFYLKPVPGQFTAQYHGPDILPGSNKAVLILANGRHIILTNAKNGKLTEQVTKTGDGQLAYSNASASAGFNSLNTPNGGQYQVTLPDGTKVWLNSASSLKYPASFTNLKERRVELKGEAYFEVIHNSALPFKVVTDRQTVEDIGTHFNVNAYDPAIKTTLFEGSIKINDRQVLVPGEQALLSNNVLKVSNGDLEEAIAWKNGYFRFKNETIQSIMPKLARWYDIDVQYDGTISTIGFYGTISRDKNISEVLTMLQQTEGVHFKIEGRRVTVLE